MPGQAEVYQENYGFVPFEFTPGIGEEDAEESQVTEEDDNNNMAPIRARIREGADKRFTPDAYANSGR